jgi:hypothetical protein
MALAGGSGTTRRACSTRSLGCRFGGMALELEWCRGSGVPEMRLLVMAHEGRGGDGGGRN